MSDFKVGIGINYWDDPDGLIRILEQPNVYEYIDKIYLIDGRYNGRDDNPVYGDDPVDYIIKGHRKVQLTRLYNVNQITKRNAYWERAEEDGLDYLVVLDSDEYININPNILNLSLRNLERRKEQCYPIMEHIIDVTDVVRPRLFKAPFNFRHIQNKPDAGISHGQLFNDYGYGKVEIINQMYAWYKDHPKTKPGSRNQNGIVGIEMWSDRKYRSRKRVIADRVYYDENKDR